MRKATLVTGSALLATLTTGCFDRITTDIGSISPSIALCDSDLEMEEATATVDTFATAELNGRAAILLHNPAADRVTVFDLQNIPTGGGTVLFDEVEIPWATIIEDVSRDNPFIFQVWVDVGGSAYTGLRVGQEMTVAEYEAEVGSRSLLARTTASVLVDCRERD